MYTRARSDARCGALGVPVTGLHTRRHQWRFFVAAVTSLATSCWRGPTSETSVRNDCGPIENVSADRLTIRSVHTGTTTYYRLDERTSFIGIRRAALGPGPAVAIVADDSTGGGPHARTITASDCGVGPGFALRCEPATVTWAGARGETQCTVSSLGGFYAAVDLSCPNIPAGVECHFQTNPVTPPENGGRNTDLIVEIAPGGAVAPLLEIEVQGRSATLKHTFRVRLGETPPVAPSPPPAPTPPTTSPLPAKVAPSPDIRRPPRRPAQPPSPPSDFPSPAGPPDFVLSCSPASLSIGPGGGAVGVCGATALNGFTGAVRLGCADPPVGITCSFQPDQVAPTAGGTASTVALRAAPSVGPGVYTFSLIGDSGALRRAVQMVVTVRS
jgi:hypothetical protein